MSLWYNTKKQEYASDGKNGWIKAYCDKALSLITELYTEHFAGLSNRHKADDIDYDESTTVKQKIDTAVSGLETALTNAVNMEKSLRETGDKELEAKINEETADREAADTALTREVDTEKSLREANDMELEAKINKETADREKADTTLLNGIDYVSNTLIPQLKSADTALQTEIDAVESIHETEVDLENVEKYRFGEISSAVEYGSISEAFKDKANALRVDAEYIDNVLTTGIYYIDGQTDPNIEEELFMIVSDDKYGNVYQYIFYDDNYIRYRKYSNGSWSSLEIVNISYSEFTNYKASVEKDITGILDNTDIIKNSKGGFAGGGASATSGGAIGSGAKEDSGGGAVGEDSSATIGFAGGENATETGGGGSVGYTSSVTTGGAVGYEANATTGGAVGYQAAAIVGGAIGEQASETDGGGAVGRTAQTTSGGAVGSETVSNSGFAGGYSAKSTGMGACIGAVSSAYHGGAVGYNAQAGNGFAGGSEAKCGKASNGADVDCIQLGSGSNGAEKTLQVYDKRIVEADGSLTDVGALADLATSDKTSIVNAINELAAKMAL